MATKTKTIKQIKNQYGNIDVTGSVPNGFVHIKKSQAINIHHLLRKLNIDYAKAMVGFSRTNFGYKPKFNGVVIEERHHHILLSAITESQKQKAAEQKKAERARKKRQAEYKAAKIEELTTQYPKLDQHIISQLVTDDTRVFATDEIGYQRGYGTKYYWSCLGFRVAGNPAGCSIKGKQIYAIYNRRFLIAKRSKMTVKQLRQLWLKKYKTKNMLLANALKIANRLQKVNCISEVYDLKDKWIKANQSNLTEGKLVRHEQKECWSCNGEGMISNYDYGYDACFDCGGTGWYSDSTLYEHNFNIEGQRFCFHSYLKPKNMSEEKGADLRNYGRAFTKDELPLPPQKLIVELINKLQQSQS
tara:strand:+ start:959 stop:2035 length:1077 start_codon:yes stop_codon:yes gene_type:complete